ncbi:MAG: NAD-dependent epimerase/dehydratase family protein [Acutalibacteraceae bacterium]
MMKVLVIGGTRYFGIHTVKALLQSGHDVTVATRGRAAIPFGGNVSRITLERTYPDSMRAALKGKHFDVVIDKIAYCSNDIKYALDVLDCDRYIYMSTTSVYNPKHIDTKESDFDSENIPFVWCDRLAFGYEDIKRHAECALFQAYHDVSSAAVRYPFVIGKDDYTKRLLFYVEHVISQTPMYIDNIDCKMGFLRSDEAGRFMAFLAENDFVGAVNGCSGGVISMREVIDYVERKTGKQALLSKSGEPAPYNSEPEYSINTDKARILGFDFSQLSDWIYDLLDYYIDTAADKV